MIYNVENRITACNIQYMIYIHSPGVCSAWLVCGVTAAVCSCYAIQCILTMWCAVFTSRQPSHRCQLIISTNISHAPTLLTAPIKNCIV